MTQDIEMVDVPDEELPVDADEGEDADEEAFPEYDDNAPNLVPLFMESDAGKEELKELSDLMIGNYEEAWDATEEYRQRMASNWGLFTGKLKPKDFPYKGCANVHVPMLIENITRNAFRAMSELFGDFESVWGARAMGPEAEADARIVTLHSNWQIREQIPDFKRQMHRGMLAFFAIGDVTCHSYYDEDRKQNRHEFLTPDEFVIPMAQTSVFPDYSDVPFMVKIMPLYRHQIQAMKDVWYGVAKVLKEEPPAFNEEPEQLLTKKMAEDQGAEPMESSDGIPYKLIWYEGWLELPNQDKDRFCRAIIDLKTRAILELIVNEEPEWQDVERYDAQTRELDDYRMQTEAHEQAIQSQQMQVSEVAQTALDASDLMGPEQKGMVVDQLQQAMQTQPEAPPAPPWMKDPFDLEEMPEPARRVPTRMFTHFVCIEPMVGTLGLGFGNIQADLNRAANTMMNQTIDAATYANVWSMIVSDQLQFSETVEFRPGAIIKVKGLTGPEIKDNIMELRPGQANPQLMQLTDKVVAWGQSSMTAPAVLSGEPGKSGETFRGINTRVEQANKQISVSTRKFADSLENVAKANAALNRVYLSDQEFISVAMASGEPVQQMTVSRKMYERNYRFTITADLRFSSKSQRVQEADELLTLIKSIPQLAADVPFVYQVAKKCLAARDLYDLIPWLGTAPTQPPQTMFGIPPPAPPQPQQPQQNGQPQQAPPQQMPRTQ
jgi:hypothetical protein